MSNFYYLNNNFQDSYKNIELKNITSKAVVFDLDETLIHCNESTDVPSDITLPIVFPHGEVIEVIHLK